MTLRRIAKSKMSRISEKHGNPIVAHLAFAGRFQPLCDARLPKRARWCEEGDPDYQPVRDCKNCTRLAYRMGQAEAESR
jgi:hypothetical protein